MYFASTQAQFDASELITQREVVSQKVNELLTERGKTFGLLLDDISIVSEVSCRLCNEIIGIFSVSRHT